MIQDATTDDVCWTSEHDDDGVAGRVTRPSTPLYENDGLFFSDRNRFHDFSALNGNFRFKCFSFKQK